MSFQGLIFFAIYVPPAWDHDTYLNYNKKTTKINKMCNYFYGDNTNGKEWGTKSKSIRIYSLFTSCIIKTINLSEGEKK